MTSEVDRSFQYCMGTLKKKKKKWFHLDINHLKAFPLHSQQFLKNNSVFQKHDYRVVGWAHWDCEQIMWFYHSCKVVGGSIPENVRLCCIFSHFVNKADRKSVV